MTPTMPLTRTNKKKALHHIVTNVLDPDHDDPDDKYFFIEAFAKAKFSTIANLISTNDATISQLDYLDDDNNVAPLEKVPIQILWQFLKYVQHLPKEGNELKSLEDWTKINVDDFDEFRETRILVNMVPTASTITVSTPHDHIIDESSLNYLLDHILELHDDHPFESFLCNNNITTMSDLTNFIDNNDDTIFNNCGLTKPEFTLLLDIFWFDLHHKECENPVAINWRFITLQDINQFSSPSDVPSKLSSNDPSISPSDIPSDDPSIIPPEVTKMINNISTH